MTTRSALLFTLVGPLAAAVVLGAFGGCSGCPSSGGPPKGDCTLDDGTPIVVGQSGPTADGCNTCICTSAKQLACTERACNDAGPPQEDAGPVTDAGVEDAGTDGGVDEGPCHDEDGDGFYTCVDPNHPERSQQIDCDDTRFHVQPGGIEFADTPEDDNCNDDNTDALACDCTGVASNARDLGAAMDLCGPPVVSASETGAAIQFGLVDAYRGVIDARRRVRQDPGLPPVVIGNTCLTTLSTGDATGTQTGVAATHCNYVDPDPASAATTGNPDVCDLAQIHFTLHVPPNASGFAFDFMFLSQEWPEYLCQIYNDTFYAIVETPAVSAGATTNAAFDSAGRPITVNVGFFENPADWTVPLDNTPVGAVDSSRCTSPNDPLFQPNCQLPSYCTQGLSSRAGSGSGWLTTSVPANAGDTVDLTLSIHDEGDEDFDSLVLLDAFRWLPEKPTLQTAKE